MPNDWRFECVNLQLNTTVTGTQWWQNMIRLGAGGGLLAGSKPPLLQRKGLLEAAQHSLASDH